MLNSPIFDPLIVGSTANYQFNFVGQLAVGETISTAATQATTYSGVDPNPQAIIITVASFAGTIVTQPIQGTVLGVIYQLVCSITTSLGNTFKQAAALAVVPALP